MNEILSERLQTGVPGLDQILEGGLPVGGVYIAQGAPGVGKTILGNQIAFHHASRGKDVLFVTLLAESHTRMMGHLRRMRFFDPSLIPDHLHYLSAFKMLQEQGTEGLLAGLREEAQKRRPSLVVIDGLVSAEEAAGSAKRFKMFIHELQTSATFFGYTVLLLTNSQREKGLQVEHTMVDGVIELTDELHGLRTARYLRVRKLRGSNPVAGQHPLEISDGGIVIHPRIETELAQIPEPAKLPDAARRAFGCPNLDRMLGGGAPDRSVTMLLGPSGSGKTVLGLQFLAEGARRGERGVCFGFYEKPGDLMLKAERLGFGDVLGSDLIELVWEQPAEGVMDTIAMRLVDAVRRRDTKRLFIDGIHGLEAAADHPERVRDVMSVLTDKLDALGVTTVYTAETRGMVDDSAVPVTGVSAITDNMILLRFLDLGSRMARVLSIFKVRDSGFDPSVRELIIEAGGIDVAPGAFELRGAQPSSADERGGPKRGS